MFEINKENIKDFFYNKETGKIYSGRMVDSYLKKHNIPVEEIKNYYGDSESFQESVYRMIYDIDIRPVCRVCGKKLKFHRGFKTFCDRICANKDPEVLEKNKAGVTKALLKAYAERGDEIKAKRAKSLGDITGSGSPFALKSVQDKIKETNLERYGVENVFQLKEYRSNPEENNRKRSIELWKSRGYDIEYNGDYIIVKNGCKIHGDVKLLISNFNSRMKPERRQYIDICPICNPIGYNQTSDFETSIIKILEENNIQYELHNRKLIKPYEIDILIPEYKLAIECNGAWYHKEGSVDNDYHLKKYQLCKDKSYQMISIWDMHYMFNVEQYKRYFKNIFNKNKQIVINPVVKECNKDEFIQYSNKFNIGLLNIKDNEQYYFIKENNNIIAAFTIKNNLIYNLIITDGYFINQITWNYIVDYFNKALTTLLDNDLYYAVEFNQNSLGYYNNDFYINGKTGELSLPSKYKNENNNELLKKRIFHCYKNE